MRGVNHARHCRQRSTDLLCSACTFQAECAGRAKGTERTESAICKTTADLRISTGVPVGPQRRPPEYASQTQVKLSVEKSQQHSGDGVINTDTCQEKRISPVTVRLVKTIRLPRYLPSQQLGRPDDNTQKLSAKKISSRQPRRRNTTCDPSFEVEKNSIFKVFASLDTSPQSRNLYEKRRNLHLNTNTQTGAEGPRARAANGIEAECDDGPSAPAVWRGY